MPGHCHCIVPGCSNRRDSCKFGLYPSEEPVAGRFVYVKKRLCGCEESRLGCKGQAKLCNAVSFHRLPADTVKRKAARQKWLAKIPRENIPLTSNSYVCGIHFPAGHPTTPEEPPTIFLDRPVISTRTTRVAARGIGTEPVSVNPPEDVVDECGGDVDSLREHDYGRVTENRVKELEKLVEDLQRQLDKCQYELGETKAALQKCRMSYSTLKEDNSKVHFYTGLTLSGFTSLLSVVKDAMTSMSYSADVADDFLGQDGLWPSS